MSFLWDISLVISPDHYTGMSDHWWGFVAPCHFPQQLTCTAGYLPHSDLCSFPSIFVEHFRCPPPHSLQTVPNKTRVPGMFLN